MNIEKRRKYCEGITSEEYIKTGKPRLAGERKPEPDYLSINEANTRYAIRNFKQWRAKRKGPEYKIRYE